MVKSTWPKRWRRTRQRWPIEDVGWWEGSFYIFHRYFNEISFVSLVRGSDISKEMHLFKKSIPPFVNILISLLLMYMTHSRQIGCRTKRGTRGSYEFMHERIQGGWSRIPSDRFAGHVLAILWAWPSRQFECVCDLRCKCWWPSYRQGQHTPIGYLVYLKDTYSN